MLRSLRFQLPALFLLGVVVAGLVSAAIALRLFRSYAQDRSRSQAYSELEEGVERPHAAVQQTGRVETALTVGTRARDRRSHLLPRARSIPRTAWGALPAAAAEGGRPAHRRAPRAAAFRLPAAGCQNEAARGGSAAAGRQAVLGDDRGGEARDHPRPALARADRAAADRVRRRRARRGGVRLVLVAPDHDAGAAALGGRGRGRARQLRRRGAERRRRRDRRARRSVRPDGLEARRGGGARAQLPDDGLARAAHAADRDPRPRRRAARRASSRTTSCGRPR